MERHVWTRSELHAQGVQSVTLAHLVREGDLTRVLPGVYCDRTPTAIDKCMAVSLWRPDAVLSHFTALWLHGIGDEPEFVEAYVRELPVEPTPKWLHLRVPEFGIYEGGAFGPDVVRADRSEPVGH
jgi:hypothetical protein